MIKIRRNATWQHNIACGFSGHKVTVFLRLNCYIMVDIHFMFYGF
ncbi:hypothetical protein HanPSC8_Chr07g0300871 [Helianthus annuus]|nr:hypothetical protein HanPSC8_Chr07g0300871 [Helianthus annuus]